MIPQPATIVLLWLLSLVPSLAFTSAPSSHAHLSPDGQRLLVMLSPATNYDKLHPVSVALPNGRSVILHETFSKSGLYDPATLAPFWQVDWFSLDSDILFSPDFTHVVRINRFGVESDWAVAFYHDGQPIRSYHYRELLTALQSQIFLPSTSWDWHVAWYGSFALQGDRLFISTARRQLFFSSVDLGLREFYTFDLATGAITSQSSTGSWRLLGVTFITLLFPLLLVLGFRRWRSARRRRTARQNSPTS